MNALSREDFRRLVFKRDKGLCVACKSKPATDVHHIVERRLWEDSGYHIDNGASLCFDCHILAEKTVLTCEQIRAAAGITEIVLPDCLEPDFQYDKWGNILMPNGTRVKGELFFDESVQKILEAGGVLKEFSDLVKYPRTWHCPWSPGMGKSDKAHKDMSYFHDKEIVITEKMDGENSTAYRDALHARSLDGRSHPSRTWLKGFHATFKHDIPEWWRVCGENMYAKHTIYYSALPSYFIAFSIFNDIGTCLSWDDFTEWCGLLGLSMPPVLYRGPYNEESIKACWTGKSKFGGLQEGYVGRLAEAYPFHLFRRSVFKYVREGHVNTSSHWMYESITKNDLEG
jgi:hypothetical protein